MWTLISDVHEKYQLPVASTIAGQVHNPKVAKMLSNFVEKLVEKSGPRQAFEVMLGDSATVPDWTLLYFKLQPRIPDQGWQTLLSLTRLGQTGVDTFIFLLCFIKHLLFLFKEKPREGIFIITLSFCYSVVIKLSTIDYNWQRKCRGSYKRPE